MKDGLADAQWRKSSYSSGNGQCVEVAQNVPGIVAVRDSKDKSGPALVFGPSDWTAFLSGIASGQFDL
jgi:hypothetical protein